MKRTFNVSKFEDYREIIDYAADRQAVSYKTLAALSHIHSSYFSRVMTGKANFSQEQLFLIGKSLGLEHWKLEYFLLLGEYFSSGNEVHRSFLRKKITEVQKIQQKVINEMKEVDSLPHEEQIRLYYHDALTALIHIYLTIEKYRMKPSLICDRIHIDETKLGFELDKLEKLQLIEKKRGKIKVLKRIVQLDDSHPMSYANHTNWRLQTIARLQRRLQHPTDYHISVVFSASEQVKIRIKEMFKEFVVEAQKEVVKMDEKDIDDVFQINFDLH